MPHSGNPIDRPEKHTIQRYQQSARWQREWPRRFFWFGPHFMPMAVHLKSLAGIHAKFQKSESRLKGLLEQRAAELHRFQRTAKKTQDYIENMKGRLDQAAADGLTVAEFIDQDRLRVRDFRTLPKVS